MKSKLFGSDQLEQARKECAIHSLFEHPNIVRLHGHVETADEITLIMEHCSHPKYLETQLAERHHEIRDEVLLKDLVR